jgi:hypothetical protein
VAIPTRPEIDIPGAHGGCQRRHERLKMRNVAVGAFFVPVHEGEIQRLPELPELQSAKEQR